ncbi:hypothetical protein C2W62_24425 [Candidatus Entotheonella serta]|nr:hypothetical protein C2W62_24425 [Candidatus Entotheonella serta]
MTTPARATAAAVTASEATDSMLLPWQASKAGVVRREEPSQINKSRQKPESSWVGGGEQRVAAGEAQSPCARRLQAKRYREAAAQLMHGKVLGSACKSVGEGPRGVGKAQSARLSMVEKMRANGDDALCRRCRLVASTVFDLVRCGLS